VAVHDLKTWPDFFQAIVDGVKTFEIRKNDRDYKVGDTLNLMEYAPGPDEYTGREIRKSVVYLLNGDLAEGAGFGVQSGHVAMALWPDHLER
jgi:hypothetical protein